MKKLKTALVLVVIFTLVTGQAVLAGDHTVALTVDISATAFNRYLNTLYNSTGFPRSYPFTYNGTSYVLQLTLPTVILTPGNAEIQMVFDVKQGSTTLYHFEVAPSINIPSNQITAAQVMAFLTDLPQKLNAISSIPQWVRDAVIQAYNTIGWTTYPSKLIEQVNTDWLASRNISVVSPYFGLGWQVSQDKLSLIVSTYLHAQPPTFSVALLGIVGNDRIQFLSTIQATVKEVRILPLGGTPVDSWFPNVTCQKGVVLEYDLLRDLGIGSGDTRIVRVVYTTGSTWFCREYGSVPVNQGFVTSTKSEN